MASNLSSAHSVKTFICFRRLRGGVYTSVTTQLVPMHQAAPINHQKAPSWMPIANRPASAHPQLVPDPPSPAENPVHARGQPKTGATCQHPYTHTQPPSQPARHNEPYLTTADHQLLTRWNVMRFYCEHTKNTRLFTAAMWPSNVFSARKGTFLNLMLSFLRLLIEYNTFSLQKYHLSNWLHICRIPFAWIIIITVKIMKWTFVRQIISWDFTVLHSNNMVRQHPDITLPLFIVPVK